MTPSEMNQRLLGEMRTAIQHYGDVSMEGDVVQAKVWRRGGMSFQLSHKGSNFECKAWEREGMEVQQVLQYENKSCIVVGRLEADLFYSHKFVLNIKKIEQKKDPTKQLELKSRCEELGLFKNHRPIEWAKIEKLGIISKASTQGYEDFTQQFKIPIELVLETIQLEGPLTATQTIEAIHRLQGCDLIIIVRGGGSTIDISNAFDTIKLFQAIRDSNVPVVTAIGHHQDQGDKLLITRVSDYDFSTPTRAAMEINQRMFDTRLSCIRRSLEKIEKIIVQIIEKKKREIIVVVNKKISDKINRLTKTKFGGHMIDLSEMSDSETIVVKRNNGQYYRFPFSSKFLISNFTEDSELLNWKKYQKIVQQAFDTNDYSNPKLLKQSNLVHYFSRLQKLHEGVVGEVIGEKNGFFGQKLDTKTKYSNCVSIKQTLLYYQTILSSDPMVYNFDYTIYHQEN